MNEEHSVIHEPYFSNCLITNLKNSHLQWVVGSREQLQQSSEVCPGLEALPKCPHWLRKEECLFPPEFHWLINCLWRFLSELGTQMQFLQAQPVTLVAKWKEEKKREVHWLNKKSLRDHLTLWPKLMAGSEYVIPLPRPHSTAQRYEAPLVTYLSRAATGRERRGSHQYICAKSRSLLPNNTAKDALQKGDLPQGPLPTCPRGGAWARSAGCRPQDRVIFLFLPLRGLFTAPHSHSKHVERIFPRHISLSELSSWIPL